MRTIVRAVFALTVAALSCATFGQTSSESKRRNVTLEEASDLVYAYLESGGCTKNSCSVDRIHDADWPAFYSFQAMWPNPYGSPNLGYFKVDPRTGDVWNGVICGGFTSPSLVKLQQAIRKRIGLSDEEYRKTPKNAPMCEQGQKPGLVRGK
jgi:hypothetical protein